MGKILSNRTPAQLNKLAENPTGIRYSLAKRIAIREDLENGYSFTDVCQRHGITKNTAHWIKQDQRIAEMINPRMQEIRRKNMASIYEYQADMALSTLTPERWMRERPASVIIGAATATDKARLLRGESTDNVSVKGILESINTDVVELRQKREVFEKNLAEGKMLDSQSLSNLERSANNLLGGRKRKHNSTESVQEAKSVDSQ